MASGLRKVVTGVAALLLLSPGVGAQEDLDTDLERGTYARAIERRAPSYPRIELDQNRQGWVQLSYVVTTDGKVIDPVIEDSSGSRRFERAALRAVEGWKFEPATWDGKEIEQCHTRTMINFVVEPTPIGASRKFVRRYKSISEKINNGDTEEALRLIDETFDSWELTVYEVSRLWTLKGVYAEKTGQRSLQLSSYRKAAANGGRWIEKKVYRSLLSGVVALELYFGQYSAAFDSYDKLVAEGAKAEDHPDLSNVIQSVREKFAGDTILAIPANLSADRQCDDCSADWQYRLMRRRFSLSEVDGSLDKLEIRCDWKRVTDTAREGVDWSIPESWGNCRLIVFGDEGTTFNLVEYPSST